eukprot:comp5054_c0_seq1/m.1149 comp5054_c0_seq1/g.1149  ORF comp5054_c0_seq1/g.1149 comp5054_c0_seq1/m.1149 type:complete len:270 (-) comp5054_c0_seq1:320-1129(-)
MSFETSTLRLQSTSVDHKMTKHTTPEMDDCLDLDYEGKGTPVLQIPISDFPPQYRKMMTAFDDNCDGIIDSSDLTHAAKAYKKSKTRGRRLMWGLLAAAAAGVLMVVATVGLVWAVVVMTKDTSMVGDALTNKVDGETVMVRQAQYKAALQDLPLLEPVALDKLSKVHVTLPSGHVGAFGIVGYDLVPNDRIVLYTSVGSELLIINDKLITLTHGNGTTHTLWQHTENYKARRALGTYDATSFSGTIDSSLSGGSLSLAACARPCLWCC